MTLPLIHAVKHGSKRQVNLLRKVIRDRDVSQLKLVMEILADTASLQYTYAMATEHVKRAKHSLARLPESNYKTTLMELADFTVYRTY
jgi:octaprenyl-diphosphate synthase